MEKIKFCLDSTPYKQKPTGDVISKISNRIAYETPYATINNMKDYAIQIGREGCSWCPATFKNGKRNNEGFEQMQFFVLDFDGGIEWHEVKKRAEQYNIPILFAYETFSSINNSRFRVVFLNDISVNEKRVAKIIQTALRTIYPESDKCSEDISHFYFGGKNLFYFTDRFDTINIESLIMNMGLYLKDTYGANNYGREIRKFSKQTGVALINSTTLAISVCYHEDDLKSEKFPPNDIIYIGNGENFSKIHKIYFGDNSNDISRNDNEEKYKQHKECRIEPNILPQKCRLLYEFIESKLWLKHPQLVGLAMNLIHVEGGRKLFLETLERNAHEHPEYFSYGKKHREFGVYYLSYFVNQKYKPMRPAKKSQEVL